VAVALGARRRSRQPPKFCTSQNHKPVC
jgi:hypothetical protein